MIDLLLLFAVQTSEPQLRMDSITIATPVPDVTPEIAPMVDEYFHCAFPDAFGTHKIEMGKEEANARARMAACADTRARAVSAAIAAYKPQPGGEPDAKIFVNRAFDTIDSGQIDLARRIDRLPGGTPSSGTAEPSVPK